MKCNFWAAAVAFLVSALSLGVVFFRSTTPWGKLKYSVAVVLLGVLVYYLGDRC